jgi:NAD(P)-dependent dehydrogenase (short-subunit alcohol dehydrogenase family)
MPGTDIVIITGAAGRLGRAVAAWWARPGVRLLLLDRDGDRLAACRNSLAGCGAEVSIEVVDLTSPSGLEGLARLLSAFSWTRPPALVLAHGVAGRSGPATARIEGLDRDQWEAVLDVNLTSLVFTIRTFLPFMRKAGGGRIVLVSSTAGLSASPTAAIAYSVAKAAVAALPRILAPELAGAGVLINSVAPGKFDNPDWPDDAAQVERYASTVPLGRIASAEEVAALVGFLSSDANTYITGQTILQDGGRLSGLVAGPRP